jgi:hypothetical protein
MPYLPPFIMLSISFWHYHRHGLDAMAIGLGCLGLVVLGLTAFNRPLLERALAFLTKLWLPVGQLIGTIIFAIAFFLVFAPVGLMLRLLRKDIIGREFNTRPASYWISRPVKEQHHYTNQF